ncbi:MAG: hypothetical protein JW725_03420 [Candidatus Babeliaceae bacterium]|nr:hypothetical protein [Candidatus Babeliaceae bacterium]
MNLSERLHQELIEFFKSLPNLGDTEGQKAFIYHCGFESQLQNLIPTGLPSAKFVPVFVSTLINYGRIDNGQYAIEVALRTSKNYVGRDKRLYCETLLQDFQRDKTQRITDSSKQPTPQTSSTRNKIPPIVKNLFSPFPGKYKQQIIYDHRTFNVSGLRIKGTYALEIENVFVDLKIAPNYLSKANLNPILLKELKGYQSIT